MKPAASSPLPEPGTVFAVPLSDGRYGITRVIAVEPPDAALIAVTPWIGGERELGSALDDPRARQVLTLTHHDWRGQPQLLWVGGPPPESWRLLGTIPVAPGEVAPSSTYGDWDTAELQPLQQWRWDHERETLRAEDRTNARAKRRLARLRAARRHEETLASLLRKRWFATWDPTLGAAAKRIILDAVGDLAHGPQPKEVSAALGGIRGCVEALNRLNLEHGGAIGQTEREDLVEALLRMGLAAGVEEPAIEAVIDASRTW